jgi:hypothetical protein
VFSIGLCNITISSCFIFLSQQKKWDDIVFFLKVWFLWRVSSKVRHSKRVEIFHWLVRLFATHCTHWESNFLFTRWTFAFYRYIGPRSKSRSFPRSIFSFLMNLSSLPVKFVTNVCVCVCVCVGSTRRSHVWFVVVRSWRSMRLGDFSTWCWLHFRTRHLRTIQSHERSHTDRSSSSTRDGGLYVFSFSSSIVYWYVFFFVVVVVVKTGIQLVSWSKRSNNIQCSKLLLPLWKSGGHYGNWRKHEVHLVRLVFSQNTSHSHTHTHTHIHTHYLAYRVSFLWQCVDLRLALLFTVYFVICLCLHSLQFDPAPRRGEPHVTRRTPDYFLWGVPRAWNGFNKFLLYKERKKTHK